MTQRSGIAATLALAVLVPLSGILLGGVPSSRAQDRPAVASGAGSTPVSPAASSAATVAGARGKPSALPRLADDPPPDEKSEPPKAAEWKTASPLRFDRSPVAACTAARIREWVRVTCEGPGSMASLIAGNGEGWSALVSIPPPAQAWGSTTHWMQFPVRRGERRLMEIHSLVPGNYGESLYVGPGMILSVQWNEGEPPRLTAHNP